MKEKKNTGVVPVLSWRWVFHVVTDGVCVCVCEVLFVIIAMMLLLMLLFFMLLVLFA